MSFKKISEDLQKMLNDFSSELNKIYKDSLISVILYGSASSGEYVPHRSDVNVLVVLTDSGVTNIAKARNTINKKRFSDIKPIFVTEHYIQSSLDTFPIEFLDMEENHAVISGKDVLSGIKIDTRNLRFQCEQELKSKILLLKTAYIRAGDEKELARILFRIFNSSLHVLRNLIRIKGLTPPYLKEEIIAALENNFGINGVNFNIILQARHTGMKLDRKETEMLITDLTRDLEQIADIADRM